MLALGIVRQRCSLITPSIVNGIIYQQPLLNEDLGSSSANTASASAGDSLLTLSKFSTSVQDIAGLATFEYKRHTELRDRSSRRPLELHVQACLGRHLCLD